jgi:hypothetical protein
MESKSVIPKENKEVKEVKEKPTKVKKGKKKVRGGYTMTVTRQEVEISWD